MEELAECCLQETFDVVNRDDITQEMFINKLKLNGIIISETIRGIECTFDFMLDPDYSDEILVLNFDKYGNFINFSDES